MSTLQTYTERTVRSTGAPAQNPINVQYDPDAFGAGIGRAIAGIGQDLQQVGAEWQKKQDEKKAADAVQLQAKIDDETRPILFDSTTGAYAQLGGNAMGVGKRTEEQLAEVKRKHIDSIEDPELRQTMMKLWTPAESQIKDTVAKHELGQLGAYKEEGIKNTINSAVNDSYNYYNNEQMQDLAIKKIYGAIDANLFGQDEKTRSDAKRAAVSSVRLAAISRWVSEDPLKALEYAEKYSKDLWGADIITANKLTSVAKDDHDARLEVARITSSGYTANRLFDAQEFAESAGDNTAVSSAGALGAMQLMPDTAREQAALLGLPEIAQLNDTQLKQAIGADTEESKQLNQLLGRAYMQRMLDRYDGDIEVALVAYNAGPKWADEFAQKNIDKQPGQRDYSVTANKKLETETREYVKKVLGRAGVATGGVAPGTRLTKDNWNLKNFKPEDLVAPTEGGNWVDSVAAQGLDAVADQFYRMFPDTPIRVNDAPDPSGKTAGRRRGTADPKDNPHVADSQHLKGRAFDVQVQGWSDEQKKAFLMAARQQGFRGVGFYDTQVKGGKVQEGHLHIDMGRERTWGEMPEWAKGAMSVPIKDLPSEPTLYQFVNSANNLPSGDDSVVGAAVASSSGNASAFASKKSPDLVYWQRQANNIVDSSKRERVMALLNNEAAIRTAEVAKQKEEVQQKAWEITLADDVSAIPPTMRAQLTPEFINGLYTYQKNAAKGSFPDNDSAWYDINMMSPEELARVDMRTEYFAKLDDEHRDKAIALQREAKAKIDGAQYDPSVIANQRTRSQIISDITTEVGLSKSAAAVFNRRFGELIEAKQATMAAGARLSETDLVDIADKLLLANQNDFLVKSKAYETKDPNSFIAATDWADVHADDQRTLYEAYTRRWNAEPNADDALFLYNSAMQVWLGGKPDITDQYAEQLRPHLDAYYKRPATDEELTNAYGRYLLELLGYSRPRR